MVKSSPLLVSLLLPCLVVLLLRFSVAGQSTVTVADPSAAAAAAASPSSGPPPLDGILLDTQLTDDTQLSKSLRFEPPHLNFGESSVGFARSYTVTLINQNSKAVYLSSVSGRKSAFYSSFFEAKVVPPQGNTTFNVVFLPREHGAISTDLLIHTSFGLARLAVSGEGRECPYRLKPIVGIKAPLNATLTPEVHMYNPHEKTLQIIEVYSSGGQFQLELPSGGQEGPQTLWQIPAYTSKPIIRIRFHGRKAGNYTAYIRIKVATNEAEESILVLPVEFEILPGVGAYAENPVIDFGRLTTESKEPLHVKLSLQHSHERRTFELVDFEMAPIPGLTFSPTEARFTLDPEQFPETRILQELVVLHAATKRNSSAQTQLFTVLVYAEVFKGTLYYNANMTRFVRGSETDSRFGDSRRLLVRNDFDTPLAVWGADLEHTDPDSFAEALDVQINKTVAAGVVLAPGKKTEVLQLHLRSDNVTVQSHIRIYTNVTNFDVPLVVCSGRLHVSTNHEPGRVSLSAEYSTLLNLGAIPLAEMSHDGYVVLHNANPLPIKLANWNFNSPRDVYFHTTFMGCLKRSVLLEALSEPSSLKIDSSKFNFCSHLDVNDMAVFQVAIQSYMTDAGQGTLKIWTGFETITIVVKFRTWRGKLEVDQEKLYFRNCFPGKLCVSDLSIRSTFQHPIHMTSINFTDAGIRFQDFEAKGSVIAPETTTKVGRIYFEPSQLCQNRCYIPPAEDRAGALLAFPPPLQQGRGGKPQQLRFDETELRRRTEMYRHLRWHFQTISFTLNSEEVKQFLLQLIIDIEWPKLVRGKPPVPVVETGKHQPMAVVLTNPADQPILVDYFLSDPDTARDTQLSLPAEVVDIASECFLTDRPVFRLLEKPLAQPVLLRPHASLTVRVDFAADETGNYCTLLHIRNNLTLYEAVWLNAKAVQSKFRFGNRKPGCETPLLFELTEKHYAGCSQPDTRLSQALVTTKRSFTARNSGEIPIFIESFYIGPYKCEGYGFKVLDCQSFELRQNASKRIDIAFTPDFTMVRVARPLIVRTNLSYEVTYQLVAQLPTTGLEACINAKPRPPWENIIRTINLIILVVMFVFVVFTAQMDFTNIIVTQSAAFVSREKGPVHPTFNLRNIGVRSQQQQFASSTAGLASDSWLDEHVDRTLEEITKSLEKSKAAVGSHQSRPNNRGNGCCHQKSSQSGGQASGGSGGSTVRKRNTNKKAGPAAAAVSSSSAAGIGRDMLLSDSPTSQDSLLTSELGEKATGEPSASTKATPATAPVPDSGEPAFGEGSEDFILHAMTHDIESFCRKEPANSQESASRPEERPSPVEPSAEAEAPAPKPETDITCAVAARGKKKQRIQRKINKVLEGCDRELLPPVVASGDGEAKVETEASKERPEASKERSVASKEKPVASKERPPATTEEDPPPEEKPSVEVAASVEQAAAETAQKKLGKRERRRQAMMMRTQPPVNSSPPASSCSATSSVVSLSGSSSSAASGGGNVSNGNVFSGNASNGNTFSGNASSGNVASGVKSSVNAVSGGSVVSAEAVAPTSSSTAAVPPSTQTVVAPSTTGPPEAVVAPPVAPKSKRALRKLKAEQRRLSLTASPNTDDDNNKPAKPLAVLQKVQALKATPPASFPKKKEATPKQEAMEVLPQMQQQHGALKEEQEEEVRKEEEEEGEVAKGQTDLGGQDPPEMLAPSPCLPAGFNFIHQDPQASDEKTTPSLSPSSECSEIPMTSETVTSHSSSSSPRTRSPATARSAQGSPTEPTASFGSATAADPTITPPQGSRHHSASAPAQPPARVEAPPACQLVELPPVKPPPPTPQHSSPLKEAANKPLVAVPPQVQAACNEMTALLEAGRKQHADSAILAAHVAPMGGVYSPFHSSGPGLEAESPLASLELQERSERSTPMQLGPIGSRKSPSSTPVWESIVGSSSVQAVQVPKPTAALTNNSSFFSNMMPAPHYNYDATPSYLDLTATPTTSAAAANAALYELEKAKEELQYMIKLQQQQQQLQAQLMGSAELANRNWAATMNAPAWSPMGYPNGSNMPPSSAASAYQSLPSWQSMTAGTMPERSGLGTVRPPPGLESNFLGSQTSGGGMQQQTQQHMPSHHNQNTHLMRSNRSNQHHSQQQQQQQQQYLPNVHAQASGHQYLEQLALQAQHNEAQQQLQQQQQLRSLMSLTQTNADEIPFDPFSSLSSIWSVDWLTNPSGNDGNRNNNNNNNGNGGGPNGSGSSAGGSGGNNNGHNNNNYNN